MSFKFKCKKQKKKLLQEEFQSIRILDNQNYNYMECTWYTFNSLHKGKNIPVTAKVPPSTAQSRVIKCRKLRRSSLIVTVIGDRSYKK